MVDTLDCIKSFKPKDKDIEIKLSENISFILGKCELREPKPKNKYDYFIRLNDDIYNIYAKDYNCIVSVLKKSYPDNYIVDVIEDYDKIGSLYCTYSIKKIYPEQDKTEVLTGNELDLYMHEYSSVRNTVYLPEGNKE